MITSQQLHKMSQIDIRKVNPATLVDVSETDINTALSQTERIEQYIEQIQNPYCFVSGNTPVKIQFGSSNKPLSQILFQHFSRLKQK